MLLDFWQILYYNFPGFRNAIALRKRVNLTSTVNPMKCLKYLTIPAQNMHTSTIIVALIKMCDSVLPFKLIISQTTIQTHLY